jgi:hypothetical protein
MNTINPTSSRHATLFAPALAVCGALALFAGCASEESHVVSAPPPAPAVSATTVTTQTTQTTPAVTQGPTYVTRNADGSTTTTTTSNGAMAPGNNVIIVTSAPPALQQDVVVAQPTGDYLWVPGYWTWRDSRYQWMAGHWEIPPYKGSQWIPPHTEQEGSAYRFYEGHWN